MSKRRRAVDWRRAFLGGRLRLGVYRSRIAPREALGEVHVSVRGARRYTNVSISVSRPHRLDRLA